MKKAGYFFFILILSVSLCSCDFFDVDVSKDTYSRTDIFPTDTDLYENFSVSTGVNVIERVQGKTLYTLAFNSGNDTKKYAMSGSALGKGFSESDTWDINIQYKNDTNRKYDYQKKTSYRIENDTTSSDLPNVISDNIDYYAVKVNVTDKLTGEHLPDEELMIQQNICLVATLLNRIFEPIYLEEIALLRPDITSETSMSYQRNIKSKSANKFRIVFAYFGEHPTYEDPTYIAGYYAPIDELGGEGNSNNAEVIYLNLFDLLYFYDENDGSPIAQSRLFSVEEAEKVAKIYLSTLIHEFCHFLHMDYSIKVKPFALYNSLTFIEGFANYVSLKLSQDELSKQSIYRHINSGLEKSSEYSMFAEEYGRDANVVDYGLGCLFMNYLEEKYQGTDFEKKIVLAKNDIKGMLKTMFGMDLSKLYADFVLQLFYSVSEIKPAGYGNMNFVNKCHVSADSIKKLFSESTASVNNNMKGYSLKLERWSDSTTAITNNSSEGVNVFLLWL